jgi:hypothetical protein
MIPQVSQCQACGAVGAAESLVCAMCGVTRPVIQHQPPVGPGRAANPRSARVAASTRSTTDETAHDMRSILEPAGEWLVAICAALLTCTHVASNQTYRGIAEGVWVHCCLSPNPFHAYASRPGGDHGTSTGVRRTLGTPCRHCDEAPPDGAAGTIVMPIGLLRFAGVLSALVGGPLLATRDAGRIATARGRMRQCADCLRGPDYMNGPLVGSLTDRAQEIGRDPALRGLAADLMRGTVGAVLAHEVGHLVYGHVDGPTSLFEVSRNAEREADSFAASALLTMPHPERALLGSVLFWSCVIHQSRLAGPERAVTHPLSTERLDAMIHSMPSAMRTLEAVHALSVADLRALAAVG